MAARASRRSSPKTLADDFLSRVQRVWGESPFYQSQLKGPAPDRLLYRLDDPYTMDAAMGARIAAGEFRLGAESLDCAGEPAAAWERAPRGSQLHRFLHEFAWLRPLAAVGEAARAPAIAMTAGWLDVHEKWSPDSWEPALVAERLVMLCAHGDLVLKDTDVLWRSRVLTSMARQTRHLIQSAHKARGNYERLQAASALTLAGLCLPGCETGVERGLELLRRELRLQLRADGGHLSRNPARQLAILIRLQMISAGMIARGKGEPGFLRHMMGRIRAHAALFRLGDGGLAIFNGGGEGDRRAIVRALEGVADDGEAVGFARYSGYQRLDAGKSTLVADVGAVQADPATTRAKRTAPSTERNPPSPTQWQSEGSFSFSVGRSRLIVNCGAGAHLPGEWHFALRQAGAHSTLSTDPAEVLARALSDATTSHRRGEDGDGSLLEMDRRFPGLGARHVRRLFLAHDGGDLRGEDVLENAPGALVSAFRLRFHLHPGVRASLSRDRRTVIMALGNGEGWRFKSNYRLMSLEKSTYCGEGGLPLPADQIVLSGDGLEPGAPRDMVIRWGFKRLSPA